MKTKLCAIMLALLFASNSLAEQGARELGTLHLGRFQVTPVIWKPVTDEEKQMFLDMISMRGMRRPEPGSAPTHQIAVFVKESGTGEVVHGLEVRVTRSQVRDYSWLLTLPDLSKKVLERTTSDTAARSKRPQRCTWNYCRSSTRGPSSCLTCPSCFASCVVSKGAAEALGVTA